MQVLKKNQVLQKTKIWNTPEGIPVKKEFTKDDIKDAEHLDFAAGYLLF